MSGLSYGGKISIGALCPVVVAGVAEAELSLSAALDGVTQLMIGLNLTPPSLAGNLSMAIQMVVQLTIALALEPPLPSVDFQVAACIEQIATIEAELQGLLALVSLIATGGIFVYSYSGPANQMGAAVTTELAAGWRDGTPTGGNAAAIILGATDGAAIAGLTTFFAGAGL
jgi:hypothetical protein